jgi:hypothetical protein
MTGARDGTSVTCSTAPTWRRSLMSSPNPLNATVQADAGTARLPTMTTTVLPSRCTATTEATSVGDAGLPITAATLSIS